MQRWDTAIEAIADQVLKISRDGSLGDSHSLLVGDSSQMRRSIKLEFLCFSDEDPEGWLYQADEYFAFHTIGDESKVQIAGCKGRMFRLDTDQGCLIKMCDEPPGGDEQLVTTTEEEGVAEISLQVLSSTFNPRTLRLCGTVKGRELTILIDSGSTHNFVQDSVVYKLGVGLQPLPEFRVFIGSGESLICREVCRKVPLVVQEVTIIEDPYVLAVEGANVVLGIQRLETLGSVTTN